MKTALNSDAVARFAAEYVSAGNSPSAANLAAFWCLVLLRDGALEGPRSRGLAMLSEALGWPANGDDVVSVLGRGRAVPADVAEALRDTFGAGISCSACR